MKLFFILSNKRGVAIVSVALLMMVATLLGAVLISQVSQDTQLGNRTYGDKQALYLAESAKEAGYQEILDNFASVPAVGSPPTVLNGSLTGQSNTYSVAITTLSAEPNPLIVRLDASGVASNQTDAAITVIAEVIRENVFVWNNAIFGGSGQTGGVINGNCAIHGSVHLLGEGVGVGNNSIEAIDLSGTSLIHNNYEGMPAELLALVPALPTQDFNAPGFPPETDIYTLNTKLRVKNGAVGVSGNSEIGEKNDNTNDFKETLNGIYIEDDLGETRWTGNAVVDGVPNPDNVQSDNLTDGLYDLGDAVSLPQYDDQITDPVDPTPSDPTEEKAYESWFDQYALDLPPLTLDGTCTAATQIDTFFGPTPPPGITVEINGCEFKITDIRNPEFPNTIKYSPPGGKGTGTATIVAEGMFQINGDLEIGQKGLDIKYDGEASFLASGGGGEEGNIDFHSNFLPADGKKFTEEGTVFGFMARNDLNLATGAGDSQLAMAGAFYANGQITSAKQNHILGTFVSQYFDMGTNVPRIYQVPNLANNLPPGMIGSEPIWVTTGFDERSWRTD